MRLLDGLMISGALAALVGCGGGTAEGSNTTVVAAQEEEAPPPAVEETEADPDDVRIEGDHLVIDRHINFETDSDTILSDSDELLDHIALLISHHQEEISHLRVIGHTDAAGGADHNQDLSERRAAAVVAALQQRGVSIALDHSGVGETEPLCQEDTDECHSSNRRVEFLIVADQ